MESLLRDLRFGLRILAKRPGFTAVIVLVLALGIGTNTIVFSVVNAVLLRPLPYPEPDRLVQIWEENLAEDRLQGPVSPLNFLDWQTEARSFERMAVYGFSTFTLLDKDGPASVLGIRVSGDFFSVLGARPVLGRLLSREDDKPGSNVVVLSHAAWQRRFAAAPGVIGQKLTLDGQPYTVIAVMGPQFQFPHRSAELWISPAFELAGLERNDHFLFSVGRLQPGTTLAEAQTEAYAIANRLAQRYPASNQGSGIRLVPLQEQIVGGIRRELLIVWGAVALVLLITCANVANLLLARLVSRQREVSVRIAIGASRGRLFRQFLAECFLLVVGGGLAGLALTFWGTHYLASGGAVGIPRAQDIRIDGWVLAFTAAASLLTTLLFGIAPALHAMRSESYALLSHSGSQMPRRSLHQRLPKMAVAVQVGITVVLLITTGLLLRSLYLLRQVDVGFDPADRLTLQLALPPAEYSDPRQRAALFQQVIDRVGAVPGVDGVGGVNDLPFSGSRTQSSFEIVGLARQSRSESRSADYRTVAGDYFAVMDITLLKGRKFELRDGAAASPVAIINEALARRFFRDVDPVGRFLEIQGKTLEIVGVVENLKHDNLAADDAPEIYVPYLQGNAPEWIFLTIQSRMAIEPLVTAVRNAVREVVPDHPIYDVQSMEERLSQTIAPQRFISRVLTLFAILALILSAVGIYGIIAYAGRQRAHEIAVRMALGARRGAVIRLVVASGFIPAAAGIAFGLVAARAATQILRALLFGVGPTDPAIFVLAPAVLAAVAALAAYVPARRATLVDPVALIRGD